MIVPEAFRSTQADLTVIRTRARMTTRRELANCIRALSMDAVQRANSGHPGMPMGMADIAQVLWCDFLKHNPGNPQWADRDRFLLSNGHGSMLLYSLLHLTGYPLSLQEIESFRQLGSHTAGHPEHEPALGIETTTGPLGQGLANAVGLALAERMLAAQFNRPGFAIVDHFTYVFCGDGCLMEGISHEACSLAGTLGLGKLIAFYDDNGISIDGKVEGWFTDDTAKRFEAYGWHVVPNVDGHDAEAIAAAIRAARMETIRPSMICCRTIIGWGAPHKQGTHESHGEALGADEVAATRKAIAWPHEPFVIPDELRTAWDHRGRGAAAESAWQELLTRYRAAHPELAREFERRTRGELPGNWRETVSQALAAGLAQTAPQATRQSSQAILNVIAPMVSEIVGGSADLTGSNNTKFKAAREFDAKEASGNYLHDGGDERHRPARRLPALRRHIPRLLRLRPQRGAPRRAHEHACGAGVHPRFDRSRGRWTHAPAGRASDQPAGHAEHVPLAAMRCLRDSGGVDGGRRALRAHRPGAHPPGAAPAAAHGAAAGERSSRWIHPDRLRGHPRVPGDRDGFGGRHCRSGSEWAERR